ncbi:60S ribosomal protein L18a [Aedes aegypti]|uniref:Uncharacterized protein n=2 Tax=Aedes aegypti TaxID=7159 RepID=A0A1S4FJS6_AEDAE|nr:60S ribosomal protein L18a [Aedes aegypti]
MTIFAPDQIVAKCRFWCFQRRLRKVKKTTGKIVSTKRILEKTPLHDSRSDTHNMYRDLTVGGAIIQCYSDNSSRHRTRA